MIHMDVTRKKSSKWPWLMGLFVLALLFWGVSTLLAPPEEEPIVRAATAADTLPPAAIPAPPDAVFSTSATRSVAEIAPLGEDDVGETVRVEGRVVATGNETFWILTNSEVLRVESSARARKGDSLSVSGTLRPDDATTTSRMADVISRQPESENWVVVEAIKLVAREAAPVDTARNRSPG